jgi:uncharacterized membrane protein YfcA
MDINFFVMAACFCAYFVKGIVGFANTIVFTSILSFRYNNINISPVDLWLGVPPNILMPIKERKSIRLKKWLPIAAIVLVSDLPGMFLLKYGNASTLKVILGVVIIGIGLEMLDRQLRPRKSKGSKKLLLGFGALTGFINGLFGIGALLAAYMERTTQSASEFRGNLCMVFLVDAIFRIIAYTCLGIVTLESLWTAVRLVPCMLLGLGAGMFVSRFVEERKMKLVVIVVLIFSGAAICITNLMR